MLFKSFKYDLWTKGMFSSQNTKRIETWTHIHTIVFEHDQTKLDVHIENE